MNMGTVRFVELLAAAMVSLTVCGCSKEDPNENVAAETESLNTNPKVSDFAVYAQNSATLRDRVVVSSGDVGVRNVSTGPTLIAGYELALASQAQVDTKRNVIANRVLLQDRAAVGDVEANKLTNQFASYSHLYSLPTAMPALPTISAVTPGTSSYTLNMAQIATISPSNLGAVSVKTKATLRLNGGTYNWASLQLDDQARLEALAPVQIRIAGRIATLSRVYVGPASGTTLAARDIRVEVSGRNGTSGQLTDNPKSSAFGNDNTVNALLIVPNGTLQFGQRAAILGAVAARDVYIDIDSRTTYQSGFGPTPCVPADCNDQNPCTTDTCNDGTCSHAPLTAGTGCSDGNACNGAETCDGNGACMAGAAVVCQASDACHDIGACAPGTGICSNPAKPDGSVCDDGNACTNTDQCKAGVCSGSSPVQCKPLDQCHTAGQCDSKTGQCSNPTLPDGSACNDANSCTLLDACVTGACVGASPVTCDPPDQCHEVGVCNSNTGICAYADKPVGTPCNDGDLCTNTDSCLVGICVGSNPTQCNPTDQCHDVGICQLATGACAIPAKDDGSSCNDANACTQTDTCLAGACTGGNPLVCTALDQCHDPGTCDVNTGTCSNPPKQDGALCNDGSACTSDDKCQAGNCQPGTPVVIDDNIPCTADACDAVLGATHMPVAEGTPCSDANACNGVETCSANGTCTPGQTPTIDDGNPCTVDSCDPAQGVIHQPAQAGTTWAENGKSCAFDDFDGSGLAQQRWSGAPVGTAPTYAVAGSRITITDATAADTDLGNQMVWPRAIGTDDFDIAFELGWSSSAQQVTLAGIGLTNSSNQLELRAGLDDESPEAVGSAYVALGAASTDPIWTGTTTETGSARLRLVRQAGNLSVTLNGQSVHTAAFVADIQNIVIFAVGSGGESQYEFGTFWLGELSVCHPNVNWDSTAACSDGDPCNGTETCDAFGSCVSATPPVIADDANPCTEETCDPSVGVHPPVAEGTACGESAACDASGQCVATCVIGDAQNIDASQDVNLFGQVIYFNDDQPIPAGRYLVSYVDGCMKYASFQGWAVNAIPGGNSWWLVGSSPGEQILQLPGTMGYMPGEGGFASFDDCVAANLLVPPIAFDHAGGVLGVWLADSPYDDNLPGVDGRNPRWRLTRLSECN
jgi:hypothetical protein